VRHHHHHMGERKQRLSVLEFLKLLFIENVKDKSQKNVRHHHHHHMGERKERLSGLELKTAVFY
jgi:hypothetical protein